MNKCDQRMQEKCQPISNTPPGSFKSSLKFYGRMLFDLQLYTIFRSIRKEMRQFRGNVLDIGCGQSPYRFLLDKATTTYFGIDVQEAEKFNYKNVDAIPFNGVEIPFEDEKFDAFICTEVLEHVSEYQNLVDEIYRVSKQGARGLITVPWSARYHYIPYDFYRFTPSTLKKIFSRFSRVQIISRGNDITSISAKIIVLFFRNIFSSQKIKFVLIPFWLLLSPVLFPVVLMAFLSLWLKLGDENDPLGYTVILRK